MAAKKIFSAALSREKDWKKAAVAAAAAVKKDLKGSACDLLIYFVSESYKDFDPKAFSDFLAGLLPCGFLIGCNANGVIANDKEVEMEPAVSVLAMHLPGVKIHSFYMSAEDSHAMGKGADLINFLDIYPTDKPHFICLADPMSVDITNLLNMFNEGYKGLPVIGGLASGGVMRMPNWLSLNGQIYDEGVVGIAMAGEIEFDVIVSQGCRPIDRPYVITKAEGNVIQEIAGRPTIQALSEILESLPEKDKRLSENSLFVGIVMNENQTNFKRGDFLIRNIVGFDPESGSLMVGAILKAGQTIQFQLRDSETSTEDLKILLEKLKTVPSNVGALLVSCCGRGRGLYGVPDHDAKMIQLLRGPLPLTGFFANGEIGPIGDKNYIHGYTSSLVIFH